MRINIIRRKLEIIEIVWKFSWCEEKYSKKINNNVIKLDAIIKSKKLIKSWNVFF